MEVNNEAEEHITTAHLISRRWQLFDLLVKNRFHTFSHCSHSMLRPIEGVGVLEHKANIRNELVRIKISRIVRIRVRFCGV